MTQRYNFDETELAIIKNLQDYDYRQNNLLFIKNEKSIVVPYRPNEVQRELINNRHKRNIIPKARQHGITTCVALHFLNTLLTLPNQRAAIIAHREADALKIFDSKIKFPFEHIPKHFKALLPKAVKLTTDKLVLDNGSSITADTMVRSETLNFLHVSELGKMAAWYPQKAEEVKTGALPAAEAGEIYIESTMEGSTGFMAELCETARHLQWQEIELTEMDYKFFFFGWWQSPKYKLSTLVERTESNIEYFEDLKSSHNIILSQEQENWYVKTRQILKHKMLQEYPSTYDESVQASTEGAYFRKEINDMRIEKRLCLVPYDNHSDVYASFDLGRNDATSVPVFQIIQKEIRFIDHYQMSLEDISHYMNWLKALPFNIKLVFLPHDAESKSLQTNKSIKNIVEEFGFETKVLERVTREQIHIDTAKRYFNRCFFDETKCSKLIESLTHFSREFNKRFGVWLSTSRHDGHSDGAKSFIYAMEAVQWLEGKDDDDEFTAEELNQMKSRHIYR